MMIARTGITKVTIRKTLFVAVVVILSTTVAAQTPGLGTWNLVNVTADLKKNWTGFFEAQIRSQKFYNNFHYHEYKGGIGYDVAKNFNITLAAGQYVTYTSHGNLDTVTSSELRVFQQFTLKNSVSRVKLDHRLRNEQRWTSNGYRNRYRYRISATIPINKKEMDKGSVYLNTSNEIFLTNVKPHFERNRFFGGLGYVFSDLFTLQSGILRQYDYSKSGSTTLKNYLQVSLIFRVTTE
jgi:hypothetical protein